MDKTYAMQIVLAVADHGSLTAAARHLDVSLPTVVRILASTEQQLGARLFDRTTRQVHITEEGSLYVEVCRRVLSEVADIEDALRDRRTEPSGTLAVTAPVLFGRLHAVPVLNSFMAAHAKVNVSLTLLDRVVDLVEEGIDVAVRIGHETSPDLVAVQIGQVRRLLCASPQMLEALPAVESPSQIRDMPFIKHAGLMSGNQLMLKQDGKLQTFKPENIRFSTNNSEAAIAACVDGLGVSTFLSYQVEDLIASGRLRVILAAHQPDPVPVSLVYVPSRRLSARARAFVLWAKERIGQRITFPASGN